MLGYYYSHVLAWVYMCFVNSKNFLLLCDQTHLMSSLNVGVLGSEPVAIYPRTSASDVMLCLVNFRGVFGELERYDCMWLKDT